MPESVCEKDRDNAPSAHIDEEQQALRLRAEELLESHEEVDLEEDQVAHVANGTHRCGSLQDCTQPLNWRRSHLRAARGISRHSALL
jgi:hypothetical protein